MKQSARDPNGAEAAIRHEASAALTWAELYSRKIRDDLKVLSPALRKSATTLETAQSAAVLRQQLHLAHRTLEDLRKKIDV